MEESYEVELNVLVAPSREVSKLRRGKRYMR